MPQHLNGSGSSGRSDQGDAYGDADADESFDEDTDQPQHFASAAEADNPDMYFLPSNDWESILGAGPAAAFDILSLVHLLHDAGSPGRAELHVFAYLSCLMSLFHGRPASEWGYAFSAVPPTLPFSPSVEQAIDEMIQSGLLVAEPNRTQNTNVNDELSEPEEDAPYLAPGPDAEEEWLFLQSLQSMSPRLPYLKAAAATAVLQSLPAVVNSLSGEPELAQAIKAGSPRMLLEGRATETLYQQFHALAEALGPIRDDLVVPASVYIRFLEDQASQALDEDVSEV